MLFGPLNFTNPPQQSSEQALQTRTADVGRRYNLNLQPIYSHSQPARIRQREMLSLPQQRHDHLDFQRLWRNNRLLGLVRRMRMRHWCSGYMSSGSHGNQRSEFIRWIECSWYKMVSNLNCFNIKCNLHLIVECIIRPTRWYLRWKMHDFLRATQRNHHAKRERYDAKIRNA